MKRTKQVPTHVKFVPRPLEIILTRLNARTYYDNMCRGGKKKRLTSEENTAAAVVHVRVIWMTD